MRGQAAQAALQQVQQRHEALHRECEALKEDMAAQREALDEEQVVAQHVVQDVVQHVVPPAQAALRGEFEHLVSRQRAQAEAWETSVRAAESQHAQRARELDARAAALEERARALDQAAAQLEGMRAEVARDAADGQAALEAVHAEQSRLKVCACASEAHCLLCLRVRSLVHQQQRESALDAHEQQLAAWKQQFKAEAAAQLAARERSLSEWEGRLTAQQQELTTRASTVEHAQAAAADTAKGLDQRAQALREQEADAAAAATALAAREAVLAKEQRVLEADQARLEETRARLEAQLGDATRAQQQAEAAAQDAAAAQLRATAREDAAARSAAQLEQDKRALATRAEDVAALATRLATEQAALEEAQRALQQRVAEVDKQQAQQQAMADALQQRAQAVAAAESRADAATRALESLHRECGAMQAALEQRERAAALVVEDAHGAVHDAVRVF